MPNPNRLTYQKFQESGHRIIRNRLAKPTPAAPGDGRGTSKNWNADTFGHDLDMFGDDSDTFGDDLDTFGHDSDTFGNDTSEA